jgi:hypothetical protein
MAELCQKPPVVFEIDTEKNRYAEYKLPMRYRIERKTMETGLPAHGISRKLRLVHRHPSSSISGPKPEPVG